MESNNESCLVPVGGSLSVDLNDTATEKLNRFDPAFLLARPIGWVLFYVFHAGRCGLGYIKPFALSAFVCRRRGRFTVAGSANVTACEL